MRLAFCKMPSGQARNRIKGDILNKHIYAGIGLVAMAILMLELVLTRIFSVILWYHFAFMAISIALLGMGVSGIYVYLFAPAVSRKNTLRRITVSALAFSLTTVVALVILLQTRFVPSFSAKTFLYLSQVYLVVAVPFFLGGLCVSLALQQFSSHVSRLYFADLLGAGIGCLLVIPALFILTGPGAVIVVSILAAWAAWNFAKSAEWRAMQRWSLALCAILVLLLVTNSQVNFLKFTFVKGNKEDGIVLERWNPFSRVILLETREDAPFEGWSLSSEYKGPVPVSMVISIDAHASTPMYKFDGDLTSVEALKYDSTSIAYHLKHEGQALIIGPGGGKDVLTALALGMKPVYGVEVNPTIVEIVKEDFADFSGHLYDRDDVHVVVDEGRSYIARSPQRFDIIQASLVDSWAATAAGAFVLTENHLYTMEAFREYYEHLTDEGILSISRVFPAEGGQTLRLVALGYEAWKACGVENPKNHLVVIRNGSLGTVLLKKSEFTREEFLAIHDICRKMNFELVAHPGGSTDPVIRSLFDSGGDESFYRSLPYNLEAPVDDKPFFFHMLRLRDVFRKSVRDDGRAMSDHALWFGVKGLAGLAFNDSAIFVLGSLIVIITMLCLLLILCPLWFFRREALLSSPAKWPLLLYFTCLGIGFMMVEIPLMQKLLLFLGHPIYALCVTLFGLLVFSGIGSYATSFIPADTRHRWLSAILASTAILIALYIVFLPPLIHRLIAIPTIVKIPLVVMAMLPLGFLMGMPFPMGIKLADLRAHAMIPWLWGVNGATSVAASVFSVAVAITFGYSVAMAIGLFAYLTASAIILLSVLRQPASFGIDPGPEQPDI